MSSTVNTDEIAALFKDPAASNAVVVVANQVTAPMVKGAPLNTTEMGLGGGVRIVFFVLDGSLSMAEVEALLRRGFNTEFVPAIKAAREGDTAALRIGGGVFKDRELQQIWVNSNDERFHPLDQLPELTESAYNTHMGYGTALHDAILKATALGAAYASEVAAETGSDPDLDIVVLSDGADNRSSATAEDVKRVVTGADKTRIRHILLFFRTDYGLRDPEKYAAEQLGFDRENIQVFERDIDETPEEMAKRVRALMRVMSQISASRNTSAVVAASNVFTGDDII